HPRALFGDDATRWALIDAARDATHVHLACHGEFDIYNPPESRLFLADDTHLTLRLIMAERPFRRARLVVLSACETALLDIRRIPDEALGLFAGILQAGVPGTTVRVFDEGLC